MGKVGRFGIFGGQYVPETVMNAVHELEAAYAKYGNDPEFLDSPPKPIRPPMMCAGR